MTQKANGQLGDWAEKCSKAGPIDVSVKCSCLALFKQGMGYRKSARTLGLRPYTVRDWLRRFKSGDESWSKRSGKAFFSCCAAQNMIQYRHEIEKFVSCRGAGSESNGSRGDPARSFDRGENAVAGSAEYATAIPLYSADGACQRILFGRCDKKKEIAAVHSLVDGGFTIKSACLVAGIPRCTYYRARKPSAKAESDAALCRLMCDIENDRHISSTYGIERLTGEVNNRLRKVDPKLASKILRNRVRVNHKRVHRLMKEHNIHSRIRRKRHPNDYYKEVGEMLMKNRAPNILKRNFTADMPMTRLTTDVTYIPCSDVKFVYLSALFDLFNHEIPSYAIGTVNSEELVESMLTALPPNVLNNAMIHNDQGSVYWSNGWVRLCERLRIVRSMSRRGNCWDNALSENFFSAMKSDLSLTKHEYKTLLTAKEVSNMIRDYIPWYNTSRIQKKLHYLSPVQFKEAHLDGLLLTDGIAQTTADIERNVLLGEVGGARLGPAARPLREWSFPATPPNHTATP